MHNKRKELLKAFHTAELEYEYGYGDPDESHALMQRAFKALSNFDDSHPDRPDMREMRLHGGRNHRRQRGHVDIAALSM